MANDKARIDWLQNHDVRVSVYNGGRGDWQVSWYVPKPPKKCGSCGNAVTSGTYPHARGETLREAIDDAINITGGK